jgi:hypothetical protein
MINNTITRLMALAAVLVLASGCVSVQPPADVPGFEDELVAVSLVLTAAQNISADLIDAGAFNEDQVRTIVDVSNAVEGMLNLAWVANSSFVAGDASEASVVEALSLARVAAFEFRDLVTSMHTSHINPPIREVI